MLRNINNLLTQKAAAWVMLTVLLLATLAVWRYEMEATERFARERFLNNARNASHRLSDALARYESMLEGAAGFVAASGSVTRSEWNTYVASLRLDSTASATQAIGFAALVPGAEKSAHELAIRAEGFPDYAIHPTGDRDLHVTAVYAEPFVGSNLQLHGYDMNSEPARRDAMARASASGRTALTRRTTLIMDRAGAAAPGFVMYVPAYRSAAAPGEASDQFGVLAGFAFIGFRIDDLMNAIYDDQHGTVALEIFDDEASGGELIYALDSRRRPGRYVVELPLKIADREWSVRFHSTPKFEMGAEDSGPRTLVVGVALSLLVFCMLLAHGQYHLRIRRAAAELQQSRDGYRTLVDNVPGTVFRYDIGLKRLTYLSDHIEDLTGIAGECYRSGAVSFAEMIHPDDRVATEHRIDLALARGEGYQVEYRVRLPDGRIKWVVERGRAFHDETGALKWRDGVLLDTTERKQAEIRMNDALKRLRLATDAVNIGIWSWDFEDETVEWDERLCAWYGGGEAKVRSRDNVPLWRLRVHPDDLATSEARLQESRRTGAPLENQFRIVQPDGSIRHIRSRAVVETDATGKPLRMTGANYDVTEREEQEARLRAAKQAAEAANATKSMFLANMSHEVRTPLNAILGLAQVLERSLRDRAHLEMIRRVRSAGGVLLRSLNDVLDWSKIEAGKIAVEQRPFALSVVLDKVGGLVGAAAHNKGLTLRFAAEAGTDLRLVGDAIRLEQILLNLTSNAIKFTDRGEILVALTQQRRDGEGVTLRFEVRDSGIGIAADKQAMLFEPFVQADASITRRFGGTGLGLSICKRLVELLGGTIGVVSREDAGSTFWFELPFGLERDREGDVAAQPPRPAVAGTSNRLRGLHVLAVDDSEMNLEVLEHLLMAEGATAVLASSGERALELLGMEPDGFDAVLMDLQMPVLDGLTVTRTIRTELGITDVPVIACSAGALPEDKQRAFEAGANDFVAKPIDLDHLVATLLKWAQPVAELPPTAHPAATARDGATVGTTDFPAIAGIDRDEATRMLRGDRTLFFRLLLGLADEFGDLPARVEDDLGRGERRAAASRLHRFRGVAGHLGAAEISGVARALEHAVAAEDPSVAALLTAFRDRLANLLEAVTPWLAEPEGGARRANASGPLDPSTLAALRRALTERKLASASRLFEELAPGLAQAHGRDIVDAIERALDGLRFAEVLDRLDALA